MLILSRKKDEIIEIGDDVQVMVVAISEGNVRLGITAPRKVSIHRKEVADRIRRKQSQSQPQGDDAQ